MKSWIWKWNSNEIIKIQLNCPWNHEYEKDILMKSWIWKQICYETMNMKTKKPWNHEYEILISVKTWIWNGIWWNVSCAFFEGISLIKLKLLSFFNARYLTVSLRGPVLNLTARAKPEFWVRKWTLKKKGHPSSVILAELFPQNVLLWRVGRVGQWAKRSFNFFHFEIY